MLAPLLDTQLLAQFRPVLRTGKPVEQGACANQTYRRFTTRRRLRSPCTHLLFQRDKGLSRHLLNPLACHAEQREPSRSLVQSHRHKSVPALMKPDHIHGDAFSATMLLKSTVRRLKAANDFATGHDKGAIAPPLDPLAFHAAKRKYSYSLVQSPFGRFSNALIR